MNLFIPIIGDKIILLYDWTFTLFEEHRNTLIKSLDKILIDDEDELLIRILFPIVGNQYHNITGSSFPFYNVKLPKGTILKIKRIYIRGNSQESRGFDSYTFIVYKCPIKNVKGVFWAKLKDINNINCEKFIE